MIENAPTIAASTNHRARLLAGMARCVATKGYADTTIADIAMAAHVSKRTFYEHFRTKQECLIALYEVASQPGLSNLARANDQISHAYTDLIVQVERIVLESGEPAGFDAAQWTAGWLQTPNAALGGRTPGEFMDTADGRELVAGLIAQMQSGAYA